METGLLNVKSVSEIKAMLNYSHLKVKKIKINSKTISSSVNIVGLISTKK